jgi:hypothetical protein
VVVEEEDMVADEVDMMNEVVVLVVDTGRVMMEVRVIINTPKVSDARGKCYRSFFNSNC